MFANRIDPSYCNQSNAHRTELIVQILEELDVNRMIDDDPIDETLVSPEDVRNFQIDELLHDMRMKDMHQNLSRESQILTLGSWSYLIPGYSLTNDELLSYNWAHNHNVMDCYGYTVIDVEVWHTIFKKYFECMTGMNDLDISGSCSDDEQTLTQYLGVTKKVLIPSNNNKRDWFLAVLIIWCATENLLVEIEKLQFTSHGDILLYKMLRIVNYAIKKRKKGMLSMWLQFVEVFLIGHNCYWMVQHPLHISFLVMRNLSGTFVRNSTVWCDSWCECESGHKHDTQKLHLALLHLNFDGIWTPEDGQIMQYTDNNWKCKNSQCHESTNIRYYNIINPQSANLCIFFRTGVPVNMFSAIKRKSVVRIGSCKRRVVKAIFSVNGEYFVAAVLLHNGGVFKWWALDTKDCDFYTSDEVLNAVSCRLLLFEEPEKCGVCQQYILLYRQARECHLCHNWVHIACLRQPNINVCTNCN